MKKKVSDLTLAVPSKQLKLLELERILDNLQLVMKLPLAYGVFYFFIIILFIYFFKKF